jgi:hypothetical protein
MEKSDETPRIAPGEGEDVPHPANPIRSTSFFASLDRLLRGREAFFDEIYEGPNVGIRLRWFLLSTVMLSALYGVTMGCEGFSHGFVRGTLQSLTSAVKVPVLFLLSLMVCFPVLYIVVVLMGARLSFVRTLSLILMALTLNSVLLASCAPIVVFFVLTGSSYEFIQLLHVAIFGFSGLWAMFSLLQGLRAMCERSDLYPRHAVRILRIWVLVFGFVGTQMAWSLRPFVGSPNQEFQLFRQGQAGNFYTTVWSSIVSLSDVGKRNRND